MTKETFESVVGGLPRCRIVYGSSSGYVVEGQSLSGGRGWFTFTTDGLANSSMRDVTGVLLGKRPARIMKGFTRIVGYYSELGNWNRSKLAELRDRHRGTYQVSEIATNDIQEASCANCERQ